MWKQQFEKHYSGIKKEDVWKIMTDINNWPKWHDDLDYCHIKGSFKTGNHFILKPKGSKPVKIVITDIKEGYGFTDCTKFPGAKMYDTHTIEETQDGVLLSNTLIVTGWLKWLWIKLVAQNIADTVPKEMESLVNLIQNKDKLREKYYG